jgi:glutathione-regulated potassium-efflux system ancillary protein KefG
MNNLIILSHPNYATSTANKAIIEKLMQTNPTNTQIRHLDQLYSGYAINIQEEQQFLLAADNIILQFPFYWYSCPASLKNWLDQVLTFNFAY